MAIVLCPDCQLQSGMVRSGVFKKPEAGISKAEVIKEAYSLPKEKIRTVVLEVIRETTSEVVDLEGAEIIILGGRGLGGPDGFKLMHTLADVPGTTVGASGAAVDAGWINHSHQVGQTGETAAPKIYIACDISGAIQHMAGVSGVDCIIATNKNPEAPILGIVNYGIVGNLSEVVPMMTEEIKKARA